MNNNQICRHFQKGFCSKNKQCPFVHDKQSNLPQPVCKSYNNEGYCQYGQKCRFRHDSEFVQNQQSDKKSPIQQVPVQEEAAQPCEPKVIHKQFKDITKTQQGVEIFKQNQALYCEGGFIATVGSTGGSIRLNELIRLFRRFQSGFEFDGVVKEGEIINAFKQELVQFNLKYVPTISRNDLTLDFEIGEGYFLLNFQIRELYPEQPQVQIQVLNESIPPSFKEVMAKLMTRILCNLGKPYSILKMIQYMDNKFQKFCDEIVNMMQLPNVQLVKEEQPTEVVPPVDQPEIKKEWDQMNQTKLEEGILLYKTIQDREEKWQKISEYVKTYSKQECLERFNYCKWKIEQQKLNKQQSSSEEEDDEDEEDASDDESDEEECKVERNSPEEEQKDEKIIPRTTTDDYHLQVIYNQQCGLQEAILEGVGYIQFVKMQVLVHCKKCRFVEQITLEKNINDYPSTYLVCEKPCPECVIQTKSFFKTQMIHQNNSTLGFYGSFTWKLRDILKSDLKVTCIDCDNESIVENVISGTKHNTQCHQCFKKFQFTYQSIIIDDIVVDGLAQKNIKQIQQPEFTLNKTKKIGLFKAGVPLPKNGTCKHYKSSYRWFRFPCCGKAFPCDICHDEVDKHEQEMARNMICGYCSQEQSVKPECSRCLEAVQYISSNQPFWEGGKGKRNKTQMSLKDSHKFKGLSKTTSKRKQKLTQK